MTKRKAKIAVVGAGIYGSTIAIKLATRGYSVTLFDHLGILCAASGINQYRVHRGYHYPRSPETIAEILEARQEFIDEYREAIVKGTENYYAIPHQGSRTSPESFEKVCDAFSLPLKPLFPEWINFRYIDKCYRVVEDLYDPEALRVLITDRLQSLGISFKKERFTDVLKEYFDFVVYATYGTTGIHSHMVGNIQVQVAEKILIRLPPELIQKSLVVIDGPFTAFDPYGNSQYSLFGSAQYTNHWTTFDPKEAIPAQYASLLNQRTFESVTFTNFSEMVKEAEFAVPLTSKAQYLGSRFTLRIVEYNPREDKRILYISQCDNKTISVFSGKVVSSVKAAKIITEMITNA
jgi:hypothetical protein